MGLRPVRPNNQWVWSLRQEGIKGLGLCLLNLSHPFWKEQNLSLPLPLPERIQWKRWCPPLLLEDPYRLHQTHNGLRLVRILYGSIPQNLQGMISLYGLTWDSWQSFFYVNNGDVFHLLSKNVGVLWKPTRGGEKWVGTKARAGYKYLKHVHEVRCNSLRWCPEQRWHC